jgi:hypothetical protein
MTAVIDVLIAHPVLAAFGLFVAGIVAWEEWQRVLRPRMVPKARIDAMADALIARYGPKAEEYAHIEEDRAWRYSETFRQGLWRRVRRELWRRCEAGRWGRDPIGGAEGDRL